MFVHGEHRCQLGRDEAQPLPQHGAQPLLPPRAVTTTSYRGNLSFTERGQWEKRLLSQGSSDVLQVLLIAGSTCRRQLFSA